MWVSTSTNIDKIFFPGGILNHILQVSIRLCSNIVIDKANQQSGLGLLENTYFWNQFLCWNSKIKNRSQFIGLRPNQIQTFDFQNQSGHPLQYSFLKSSLMKFNINPSIHQVTRTLLGRYHKGRVVNHNHNNMLINMLKDMLIRYHNGRVVNHNHNNLLKNMLKNMLIRYHNGRVVNHSPDLGKVVSRPSSDWGSSLLVSTWAATVKIQKHEKLFGLCFLVITQASDLIVRFPDPLADGSGSGNLTTDLKSIFTRSSQPAQKRAVTTRAPHRWSCFPKDLQIME